jgi:hypothetical protein
MIAYEVNVNREAVRRILTEELGMRKICTKMVPRNLKQQQRDAWVRFCVELLEQVEADPELMERVITGDESWFSQYDPETKRQSLEWRSKGSPRPKKARISKSKVKCMLVCFFESMDIVHKAWVPAGQSVNITTKTVLKDSERESYGLFQILPQTGSITTTMRQPIQHFL